SFATGKELDESNLYYFGARYYDSESGRFTSVDPVKENHAYSYVNNNPLNLIDPTGMGGYDVGAGSLSVNIGENTEILMNDIMGTVMSEEIDDPLETFYVIAETTTIVAWDLFDYDHDRAIKTEDKTEKWEAWSKPYLRKGILGKVTSMLNTMFSKEGHHSSLMFIAPELSTMLFEGKSVCYEKAIFTSILLGNAKEKLGLEGIEILMNDIPGHASVSIINTRSAVSDTTIVDWGNLYNNPSDYYQKFKDDKGNTIPIIHETLNSNK
ncbi:RHS repeat-associated core domain-containing protein, partial [archaeon]|nr:RHS repeat-associated core domain-containing protein [archaeon]